MGLGDTTVTCIWKSYFCATHLAIFDFIGLNNLIRNLKRNKRPQQLSKGGIFAPLQNEGIILYYILLLKRAYHTVYPKGKGIVLYIHALLKQRIFRESH